MIICSSLLAAKKPVVNNICQINESLSAIITGRLDTVVNARSHVEFNELSNDINATVETFEKSFTGIYIT